MNSLNKISLSLALLLFVAPAVKAVEDNASDGSEISFEAKETSNSLVQKAKDYAVSSKDAVVDYVNNHKKASIATGLTASTILVGTGLYRWCQPFRNAINSTATKAKNAANDYVCTPVKNKFNSYSTKAKLGTASGLTLGVLAAYFGIQKYKQSKSSVAESK